MDLNIQNSIEFLPEFNFHRFLSFVYDQKTGLKGFISIHRGGLINPAFGATRIWKYKSEKEALLDALKLSKTMSYKSALAGLKYGGAKATLIIDDSYNLERKEKMLQEYAKKVNYLAGHFVTGADVGASEKDVQLMKKFSPFIVGTKVDPVKYTIQGLFNSIEVCLNEVFGNELLEKRSFAIKGLGKVGFGLLNIIGNKACKVYVADINEARLKEAKTKFPNVKIIEPSDIDKQNVDVFSPCALSNCINKNNVQKFHCKIIAGGANCQLENNNIGEILHKSDILYAPDYVVNAGGLISVVDEYEYKDFDEQRIFNKVNKIKSTLKNIIETSKRTKKSTNFVADNMAKDISDRAQ